MRLDQHQAFGLQLEESLTHRNAADLEAGRQRVLAQLFASGEGAVQDVAPQLLDDGGRQGAVAEAGLHENQYGCSTGQLGLDMWIV